MKKVDAQHARGLEVNRARKVVDSNVERDAQCVRVIQVLVQCHVHNMSWLCYSALVCVFRGEHTQT